MAKLPSSKTRRDYRTADGAKLSGVTTILGKHLGWKGPALIQWAFKVGRDGGSLSVRDDAAALGSCVHALVAADLGGEAVDASEWRVRAAQC
jgi:hypothetical protein